MLRIAPNTSVIEGTGAICMDKMMRGEGDKRKKE
jgi:hypothetical protein